MLIGKSLKTFEINGSLISSNIQLKPKGKLKCYVQCICLFDLLSSFHSSWHYVCFGRVSGAAPKHNNFTALSRRAPCRALPHWLLTLSFGTHLLHHQAHRHNADDVHLHCTVQTLSASSIAQKCVKIWIFVFWYWLRTDCQLIN